MRFTDAKSKRIARLIRILGSDSLEEVFGSQVTIAILRPLRFHRLCRSILKKPGGKDRRSPNNYVMKYDIRVPRNVKEAAQFNGDNGDLLWTEEILKELESLMSMKFFKKLSSSFCKARAKGFRFAPLGMIFDYKVVLRRKEMLVIGGHVVDSSIHKFYESTMKSISAIIMMKIAAANNLDVMTGYIGNAHLNENTEEKNYTRSGAEFKVVGIMDDGTLLKLINSLYVLPTSRNRCQAHLLHTLR